MSTSLSTLVDNLSNRIHDNRKCTKCNSSLEYISISKKVDYCLNALIVKKNTQKSLIKNLQKSLRIHTIFVMEILISLCFY